MCRPELEKLVGLVGVLAGLLNTCMQLLTGWAAASWPMGSFVTKPCCAGFQIEEGPVGADSYVKPAIFSPADKAQGNVEAVQVAHGCPPVLARRAASYSLGRISTAPMIQPEVGLPAEILSSWSALLISKPRTK